MSLLPPFRRFSHLLDARLPSGGAHRVQTCVRGELWDWSWQVLIKRIASLLVDSPRQRWRLVTVTSIKSRFLHDFPFLLERSDSAANHHQQFTLVDVPYENKMRTTIVTNWRNLRNLLSDKWLDYLYVVG